MPGKSKIKWIKSLQVKKYRQAEQCFLVQGWKGVEELLTSRAFPVDMLLCTDEFQGRLTALAGSSVPVVVMDAEELQAIGSFQSNASVLAVAQMKTFPVPIPGQYPIMVLDDIRDPGNMGTIIRTADWFGIPNIVASDQSVDFYNPKVISATMGSFCRVNVHYAPLDEFLKEVPVPVFGAFLDGKPLASCRFPDKPILVIGNESNGISEAVEKYVTERVTIPGAAGAESLNAAVAAGILLYAFHQRR